MKDTIEERLDRIENMLKRVLRAPRPPKFTRPIAELEGNVDEQMMRQARARLRALRSGEPPPRIQKRAR